MAKKLRDAEVMILLANDPKDYNFYRCAVHGVSAKLKTSDLGLNHCSRKHDAGDAGGELEVIEDPIGYAQRNARKGVCLPCCYSWQ